MLIAFACLPTIASAGLFLARLPEHELKRVLLAEIEKALGSQLHDVTKQRVSEIEAAMRPTFDVLPKGKEDKLDHDGVRYLLNRVFAQQHGWFINGLQSGGEQWNSSSTWLTMTDHLPELLQELFEKRIGDGGSSLHDVVALAAMVEHLIRDELRGKLETVFRAKRFALDARVNASQALNLMELYMICFLRGQDASAWDLRKIELLEKRFHRQYPAWDGVKQLIAEVQADAAFDQADFSFDDVAGLLEILADRFTPFYESQCEEMKGSMLDMEDRRSGRVRLADFYEAALHDGMYQFTETVEVLRHMGTLDEAEPSNPRVIIPNYISGLSNCIARTSFYATCCPNNCETLLNRVERVLGKSAANPSEIIAAVEDPRAALESGFRGLTPWLKQRLHELGQHHGGQVPLHGRLFAQWMHFVHPRDCIYPHLSGTIYMKSLDDWEKDLNRSSGLTMDQLRNVTQHLNTISSERYEVSAGLGAMSEEPEHVSRMWTMEEELFVKRDELDVEESPAREAIVGKLAMCALFVALIFSGLSGKWKAADWSVDDVGLSKQNV